MSEVKVNKISPRTNCGTVQLGDSGDTITIPSGVTQTGVGRQGTVDWDTTAKTASFTAVSGNGYFVDTTSGAITVTLPASPSAGDIMAVSDYNGSAVTNTITIARNGSNINGNASNYEISKANSAVTFVYVDATVGWTSVQTSNTNDNVNPYMVATGGTITECGDFKIHTFTGPGTFTVSKIACGGVTENTVGYLVVAGGGSGGSGGSSITGGGGGAGGFREGRNTTYDNFTASPLVADAPTNAVNLSVGSYPITVGAGGSPVSAPDAAGNSGSPSTFSTITSAGGGRGGSNNTCAANGGSGGGGKESDGTGGSGNTPPVSPPQGQNGGNGSEAGNASGGGGGAGAAGGTHPSLATGGNGVSSSITGSSVARAGGGGANASAGGSGGGGDAGGSPSFPTGSPNAAGGAGTANTGGGGGGAAENLGSGAGGSGVVIIRYKFQ